MPLARERWGVVGGDDEPPLLLKTLAERHPGHEFVLVGRNSGERPGDVDLPTNVTNPWTELRDVVRRDLAGRDQPQRITGDDLQHVLAVFDHHVTPLFRDLDALIVWAGQHGTSNSPIPKIGAAYDEPDGVTQPQKAFTLYVSYVVRGVNAFRESDPLGREEVWLVPDPRNYPKARDLKWPQRRPILAQFNFSKREKFERYRDPRTPEECGFDARVDETGHVWHATQRYVYSGLELCGVLPGHVDARLAKNWNDRAHLGLFINEARAYVKRNRLDALIEYVLPLRPHFVHGKWSAESLAVTREWGYDVQPAPAAEYYAKLRSVKSTFTTPSSGSGWATTKPWQAFAVGTVCFFHPEYDTQGHIVPTLDQVERGEVPDADLAHLARWLRVRDPAELAKRVKIVDESEETWRWLTERQRELYDAACRELRHVGLIEERLGIT
jgi:hypothetical protein